MGRCDGLTLSPAHAISPCLTDERAGRMERDAISLRDEMRSDTSEKAL